ncbi:hypothetical protein ITP53_27630 [Nonomuraea sp. K274]|uniref:Uncharacterized protein n=1 Tax=Nonomuraea cypriaca TaxID=1187855 RepID=A0A931F0I3_9ACTN|nr:hypothetical protein [Nonomuraea cypriaca]MBF8189440.1 hypothetical protein [Nonomuraea cypriaca]
MPSCVPREDARYLGSPRPTLALYSRQPILQLPRFRFVSGRPSVCTGWEFVPGVTFTILKSPGKFSLLVEGITHPDETDERFAWLNAVDRAGGAVVLAVNTLGLTCDWESLTSSPDVRGGFIPIIRRSG